MDPVKKRAIQAAVAATLTGLYVLVPPARPALGLLFILFGGSFLLLLAVVAPFNHLTPDPLTTRDTCIFFAWGALLLTLGVLVVA